MTVDFATYCCEKDIDKLGDNFIDHMSSHNYYFDKIYIIYQRVKPKSCILETERFKLIEIKEQDYDGILKSYNINPDNKEADDYTHGWNHSHYWRHHCVNHLVALRESTADYIVLCDADCHMVRKDNWIKEGIKLLQQNSNYLVISPSDGSKMSKTQNMSQQLFLCERKRMASIDFDLPFTGFRDGGPMQEYYFMLEGRIGRYMEKNGLYRYILSSKYRYWHKQWH